MPGESVGRWRSSSSDHRRGIVDPSGLKCPGRADQAQAIEAARPVEGKLANAAAQPLPAQIGNLDPVQPHNPAILDQLQRQ